MWMTTLLLFLELESNHAKIKATSFPGATVPSYTSKTLMA